MSVQIIDPNVERKTEHLLTYSNADWGMATSMENKTDMGGRILLGYPTSNGKGCFRNMRATAFVAEIEDVPEKDDDGVITDGMVTYEKGRTILEFTAKGVHVASDAAGLSWNGSGGWPRAFGYQRLMWASGEVSAKGGHCSADELHYHFGNRILAGLNFPNMVSTVLNVGRLQQRGR